ncbi:MAG: AzlD domain-containing protein [Rubrivivax sp.]
MSLAEGLVAIIGLALLSLLTRGLFFLLPRDVPLPPWLDKGLRYAPIGAMAAIVAPEVLTDQGRVLSTLADARPWAALAGAAWYFWRRSILGTILSGTAVLLILRLGLGW